jgi:hypothetical protein
MSTLRTALRDYLSLQRGLGYKYVHQERTLTSFTLFMERRKTTFITTKLALERATQSPGRHASWALPLLRYGNTNTADSCIGAAPRASASTVDIPLFVWALGGHGPTNWRVTGAEA